MAAPLRYLPPVSCLSKLSNGLSLIVRRELRKKVREMAKN